VIKRITLIENTGSYGKFTNTSNVDFNFVTIIYGENRYGKSTFCDIFHSLALNDPKIIMDRKTINPLSNTSQAQQRIKIQFSESDNTKTVTFVNDVWDSQPLNDSKLYVFDQGFIHRNVMTGMTYNRDNSENISSFILGENSIKFEELEVENQKIRETKSSIKTLTSKFRSHDIHNIDDFIASSLSKLSLTELDANIQKSKELQQKISTQITNILQVNRRSNLEGIIKPRAIDTELKSINDCLGFSMENVHKASKAAVITHKIKVNNSNTFDVWAAKGINHLKEDCPFCGQELNQKAKSLIENYQTAFNDNFQNFVAQTKSKAAALKGKALISANIEDIQEKHDRNLAFLGTYIEDDIRRTLDKYCYVDQLLGLFQSMKLALSNLHHTNDSVAKIIEDSLDSKQEAPYNPVTPVDFTELKEKLSEFDDSVVNYNNVQEQINVELNLFKESYDIAALQALKGNEHNNEKSLLSERKRLHMNNDCINFSNLCSELEQAKSDYKDRQEVLIADQEDFLNQYFDEINALFSDIGSGNFNISRNTNNIGTRTVYELKVSFKGVNIGKDKFHCLFSESDRRALALCVFFAKINKLSNEERKKAILVMDDPVTSFDHERISSILQKLHSMKPPYTRQIVVTTHYKGMASSMMRKFNKDTNAIKIIQTPNGSILQRATTEEMTETAHDKRYNEIMAFINRVTNDDKIEQLRVFVDHEMRSRYKQQLELLNLSENDSFHDCMIKLKELNHISERCFTYLDDFRGSLNTPLHNIEERSVEDSRTYADNMMRFIYTEL